MKESFCLKNFVFMQKLVFMEDFTLDLNNHFLRRGFVFLINFVFMKELLFLVENFVFKIELTWNNALFSF
jgi:hypothetical protein